MRFSTLEEWLAWQEGLHPSSVDLGLERVAAVLERMGGADPGVPVITVAGTNGKGSTVAFLEAILAAAGYRVGAYTSPHLHRYNERVRIAGAEATDAELCAAFDRVDRARGETSLTYFEFGTLAALDLFRRAGLDAVVLEVGLGGRLDAVNAVDPDVAVITTVDLDHGDWLGTDREAVAAEKAGVLRYGRPAVYGDRDIPEAVIAASARLEIPLYRYGREFGWHEQSSGGAWWGPATVHEGLPALGLPGRAQGRNAASALMALALLQARLPVTEKALRAGLASARVPGRMQTLPGPVAEVVDVGHNPQAARGLAEWLRDEPCDGRTHLVLAMLADKDIEAVAEALAAATDQAYVAPLEGPRAAPAQRLLEALETAGVGTVTAYANVPEARAAAFAAAAPGDRVVVAGSFYTAGLALAARAAEDPDGTDEEGAWKAK